MSMKDHNVIPLKFYCILSFVEGRTSDKYIIENCGIFNLVIRADSSLTVKEFVCFNSLECKETCRQVYHLTSPLTPFNIYDKVHFQERMIFVSVSTVN